MENRKPEDLRIAIYSQDDLCLGHKRCTSSIAREIYWGRSEASILLTFSYSQLGQFFPLSPNHDFINPPSSVKNRSRNWQANHLRMSYPEILQLRQQLITNALLTYAPDIFLVNRKVGQCERKV